MKTLCRRPAHERSFRCIIDTQGDLSPPPSGIKYLPSTATLEKRAGAKYGEYLGRICPWVREIDRREIRLWEQKPLGAKAGLYDYRGGGLAAWGSRRENSRLGDYP